MFDNLNWIEIAGYVASIVVAFSLMMSSIVKLRWYNLFGAALFSVYGFIIKAYPVGFLNAFIAAADIYYLVSMYRKNEYFTIQRADSISEYLHYFFRFYEEDIAKYFPEFSVKKEKSLTYFYLLRDVSIAGIVAGKINKNGYFQIDIDYAAPEYRDLKLGNFFFSNPHDYFQKYKIKGFTADACTSEHERYLEKMNFQLVKSNGKYKNYKLELHLTNGI